MSEHPIERRQNDKIDALTDLIEEMGTFIFDLGEEYESRYFLEELDKIMRT